MKQALMYGAGNIGRGFIGKVFSESGYEVCFIDVDEDIVNKINEDGCYPVKIIDNDLQHEDIVRNVRAVSGRDTEAVSEEIARADIMATAVGVNVLPKIVAPVCAGLKKRFERRTDPLNIIICENMLDADKYLRKMIEFEMGADFKPLLDKGLGLIEASIGRMVPVLTNDMREGNILKVWVEPYSELPVDKDAFLGEIPALKGLVPFSPFGFYIKRKLFIHNMAHALCAYIGWQKGYDYIFECVQDKQIRYTAELAMKEVSAALHKEYGVPLEAIHENVYDLLHRFGNIALKDSVARVAKDPVRKLGRHDRLVGAALYCRDHGVSPRHVIKAIVAGLKFDNPDDQAALELQDMIRSEGIEKCLSEICGLSQDNPLFKEITSAMAE